MKQLADSFGIARESLYSRLNNPKYETIKEVADKLDCMVPELFDAPEGFEHWYEKGQWLGIRKKH